MSTPDRSTCARIAAVERDGDVVALADDAIGERHGLRCDTDTGSDDFLEAGDEPRGRSCDIAPSLRGDTRILAHEVRRTRVGCKQTTENVVRPNDPVIVVYEQESRFDVIDEHRETVRGAGRRSVCRAGRVVPRDSALLSLGRHAWRSSDRPIRQRVQFHWFATRG